MAEKGASRSGGTERLQTWPDARVVSDRRKCTQCHACKKVSTGKYVAKNKSGTDNRGWRVRTTTMICYGRSFTFGFQKFPASLVPPGTREAALLEACSLPGWRLQPRAQPEGYPSPLETIPKGSREESRQARESRSASPLRSAKPGSGTALRGGSPPRLAAKP